MASTSLGNLLLPMTYSFSRHVHASANYAFSAAAMKRHANLSSARFSASSTCLDVSANQTFLSMVRKDLLVRLTSAFPSLILKCLSTSTAAAKCFR